MQNPITMMLTRSVSQAKQEDAPAEEPKTEDKSETSEINEAAIQGEDKTGFEMPEGKGPFNCWNCEYYGDEMISCDQKDMKAQSKRPRLVDGKVLVHPFACCEFVERQGKFECYEEMVSEAKK